MAIWNGVRWYVVVLLICVPLLSWDRFFHVQFLESFYHKHLLNYFKNFHQLLMWSYCVNPSLYIHMQLLKNFSISGINPTLIYGVQSFYGIGGIFCSYFAKDVCLCSSMRYWSLTFFFCVFLVLVSGWWWTCKMSFGFPSTLEFWKCFRSACASSFLTGS